MRVIFLFFCFYFLSCSEMKRLPLVSLDSRVITFDKVKVKIISSKYDVIDLRGYVSVFIDSLICFNLNGPLGMKALSGKFDQNFIIKDYYNDKLYNNLLKEIELKSGINFNKECLENFLLCRFDTLSKLLKRENKEFVTIVYEPGSRILKVYNRAKDNLLEFEYLFKRKIPKEINILYTGSNENWQVKIEVVSISNIGKKCNFVF
jgi:hypothetical protein